MVIYTQDLGMREHTAHFITTELIRMKYKVQSDRKRNKRKETEWKLTHRGKGWTTLTWGQGGELDQMVAAAWQPNPECISQKVQTKNRSLLTFDICKAVWNVAHNVWKIRETLPTFNQKTTALWWHV